MIDDFFIYFFYTQQAIYIKEAVTWKLFNSKLYILPRIIKQGFKK